MIPKPLERLIEQLGRLPGIGRKTAARLAFHILEAPEELTQSMIAALAGVLDGIVSCSVCGLLADAEPCGLCTDARREGHVLCVVEGTPEVLAIERTGAFKGRYHTLGGVLSPLDGVGPDQLRIAGLMERISAGAISELIVAIRPTVDGEATAHYLARVLRDQDVTVTRIASGIPMGASIEYADQITLARAFEGRRDL